MKILDLAAVGRGVVVCVLAASAAAQSLAFEVHGRVSDERGGKAVALAGDVDADGFGDVVVGFPAGVNGVGRVEVRSGRDGALLHEFLGDQATDALGSAVCGIGDADGDGHADVAAGAPQWNNPTSGGLVRVYSGRTGAVLFTKSGAAGNEGLGRDLSGPGDVDGDGYDDVLAGSEMGLARLFSGRTGLQLRRFVVGFGAIAVAGVGDTNGDRVPDMVMGAHMDNRVRLYAGRTWAVLWTKSLRFSPPDSPMFGAAVAGTGDVDGDGVGDVAVGAPLDTPRFAGTAFVYSGVDGQKIFERSGDADFDGFGRAVGGGDVDGDGLAEVLVGADQGGTGGYVHVCASNGAIVGTYLSGAPSESFGAALGAGADLDGDGVHDVVIGAPSHDSVAPDAGVARVYSGAASVDPGSTVIYGVGCPGADGRLPRLHLRGRPVPGGVAVAELRSAPGLRRAILRVAGGRQSVELSAIGMPGCWQLTELLVDVTFGTDLFGNVDVPLPIPSGPSLIGVQLNVQWFVVDPLANPLGIVGTPGGEIRIGAG
ncbi:MAG: integrin alpha [Planctomycetota bacterium]